jgi:hypothetical protein
MRINGDGPPLWCADHGDSLSRIAARFGKLSGPAAEQLRARWSMQMASAVWRGRANDLHAVVGAASANANVKAATKIALKNDWIEPRENGRGYERGEIPPPGFDLTTLPAAEPADKLAGEGDALGRLPISVRVERLRALVAERGEVTKAHAAEAIGLRNANGSFIRILKSAVADGHVTSGTNVVGPGPALTQAA